MHSSAGAAVWMKQDVGCLPMGSLKGDDFESQPLTRKEERGGVTYLTGSSAFSAWQQGLRRGFQPYEGGEGARR